MCMRACAYVRLCVMRVCVFLFIYFYLFACTLLRYCIMSTKTKLLIIMMMIIIIIIIIIIITAI